MRKCLTCSVILGNNDPYKHCTLCLLGGNASTVKPPVWSGDNKDVVDWFMRYVSKMTVTKHAYNKLVARCEIGESDPGAQELIKGLKLAQRLVNGTYKAKT